MSRLASSQLIYQGHHFNKDLQVRHVGSCSLRIPYVHAEGRVEQIPRFHVAQGRLPGDPFSRPSRGRDPSVTYLTRNRKNFPLAAICRLSYPSRCNCSCRRLRSMISMRCAPRGAWSRGLPSGRPDRRHLVPLQPTAYNTASQSSGGSGSYTGWTPQEKAKSWQVCCCELTAAIHTGILNRAMLRAVAPLLVGTKTAAGTHTGCSPLPPRR